MNISIIIPTHNRQDLVKNVIESIIKLKDEADFEFVIVDNNSTDGTKQIVESYSKYAKYVFEKRTSFTRARKTGAENSIGDILLYLDDDVIVNHGSLKNIINIFQKHPECGIIAGKILPKYLEEPPKWSLECQESFNGWSLYKIDETKLDKEGIKEVTWAAGPMMAIRKVAYDKVGGFPPDTIGVESNKGERTFNKLYIGPGDYGLCHKIREEGYKVYYSNNVSVYHLIPALRFTIKFWRSRMIGEAYHMAISEREFFKLKRLRLDYNRYVSQKVLKKNEKKLLKRLNNPDDIYSKGMSPEELWVHYYKAYLDMDTILREYPDLSSFLWEIGEDGIDDVNFDYVMNRFPEDFKKLVHNNLVYNSSILRLDNYTSIFPNFGYHTKKISSNLALYFQLYKINMKLKGAKAKIARLFNFSEHGI